MKCHVCGGKMESVITDLPFKTGDKAIVIMKNLPVYQCNGCSEYLLDNPVMEKIDAILKSLDDSVELEIVRYAA